MCAHLESERSCYEKKTRPKYFSVTCYVVPKSKERIVWSQSEHYDSRMPSKAVDKWFGSSILLISRLKEHKIDGVLFVPCVQSTTESLITKSRMSDSTKLLSKDIDINRDHLPRRVMEG
ncbi:hypothetical protein HELRODRAFT_161812 [Helobdella robusta]|uniref:Uncharacterized protein n=1 Tax=Helobdella robusta TaxID=6412 RepID=T1ERX8_HELRO|nr:hypothetical protein HELRODRAFT_161812 [Helobdella robusta]ESO02531.1 hypothetical protein HELRODRAFT_161812 [Helobdella robusta]